MLNCCDIGEESRIIAAQCESRSAWYRISVFTIQTHWDPDRLNSMHDALQLTFILLSLCRLDTSRENVNAIPRTPLKSLINWRRADCYSFQFKTVSELHHHGTFFSFQLKFIDGWRNLPWNFGGRKTSSQSKWQQKLKLRDIIFQFILLTVLWFH